MSIQEDVCAVLRCAVAPLGVCSRLLVVVYCICCRGFVSQLPEAFSVALCVLQEAAGAVLLPWLSTQPALDEEACEVGVVAESFTCTHFVHKRERTCKTHPAVCLSLLFVLS